MMPLYAICPFFLYEKSTRMGCEAGMMRFPSHNHMVRLMTNMCCTWDYKKCKRYQKLMREYEKEEMRDDICR